MRLSDFQHIGLTIVAAIATGIPAYAAGTEADTFRVIVLDQDGEPVPNVAIVARSAGDALPKVEANPLPPARMHQKDREFVPHILIVEKGAVVEFPNHDDSLHHVYSFSEAKRFEIPLYGGAVAPTLTFDRAGLVTLGCNIHDGMLGYILVVDTPHFAKTDTSGLAVIANLPQGQWSIETWTPRLRPERLPAPVAYSTTQIEQDPLIVRFDSKLRPPHAHSDSSLTWDLY